MDPWPNQPYHIAVRREPSSHLPWLSFQSPPVQVLTDFVVAINPSAAPATALTAGTARYLRNVVTEAPKVLSASQCPQLTGCQLPSTPICPYVYK